MSNDAIGCLVALFGVAVYIAPVPFLLRSNDYAAVGIWGMGGALVLPLSVLIIIDKITGLIGQ